jgi:hypothetical protein
LRTSRTCARNAVEVLIVAKHGRHLGEVLRRAIPVEDPKDVKELRRLIAELERRQHEQNA